MIPVVEWTAIWIFSIQKKQKPKLAYKMLYNCVIEHSIEMESRGKRGVARFKVLQCRLAIPVLLHYEVLTSARYLTGISSVQPLGHVRLFATPWTATHQASLSITNSWSLLKLMSIKSVMPSNHLILCCPLFLLPSIFPSIGVFSNESVLCIRWPKYWSFRFSISPSNEHPGLTSFIMDWLYPLQQPVRASWISQ